MSEIIMALIMTICKSHNFLQKNNPLIRVFFMHLSGD